MGGLTPKVASNNKNALKLIKNIWFSAAKGGLTPPHSLATPLVSGYYNQIDIVCDSCLFS